MARLLLDFGAHADGPLRDEYSGILSDYKFGEQLRSPLFLAAETGNERLVRLLLENGADPNISALDLLEKNHTTHADSGGYICRPLSVPQILKWYNFHYDDSAVRPLTVIPLQAASGLEDATLANLLLQHGGTINPRHGTSPLAIAAFHSRSETVRLLLDCGADVNAVSGYCWGFSALEGAVHAQNIHIITLLLEAGADINQCSPRQGGRTPLQLAAEMGNRSVIQHLLDRGANLVADLAVDGGISALQGFVEHHDLENVGRALAAGVDPNMCSQHARSPLTAAVAHGYTDLTQLLIQSGADVETPASVSIDALDPRNRRRGRRLQLRPLAWAAATGDMKSLKLVCEAGADINAEWEGHTALTVAAAAGHAHVIEYLLEHGDARTLDSIWEALRTSISENHVTATRQLLRHAVNRNLNFTAAQGSKLLEKACFRGHLGMLELVLTEGAHMSVDVNDAQALGWLCGYKWTGNAWREAISLLLHHGRRVNCRAATTDTALQQAVMKGDYEMATRLLQLGADVNAPPSTRPYGRTALQAAAEQGNVHLVQELLSAGANVNAPAGPRCGVTTLQASCISGHLRITQILLEHGADTDAEPSPNYGLRAINGAAAMGRLETVKLLLDNYDGPRPKRDLCRSALKDARICDQWHVVELLEGYQG
ncbi:hypothetical protein A1O3_04292 [Capronia epimyces CBS 606.96]|uniref:Uncharacterized protein n=1 Tax=Capronia epimyces CBS 606.96 TaxID=1182542 RepID=W9Y4D2_9EURO|nr:uncharacterized protein A1O3_04292 [Capronia epimyces CBS 606.96]EXJ87333.1 hypothetical protein A1O3_04292 [Capronia epimyces CBS 606.96]